MHGRLGARRQAEAEAEAEEPIPAASQTADTPERTAAGQGSLHGVGTMRRHARTGYEGSAAAAAAPAAPVSPAAAPSAVAAAAAAFSRFLFPTVKAAVATEKRA